MLTEAHKNAAMTTAERVLALAGDPLPFFNRQPRPTLCQYADAVWQAYGDEAQLTAPQRHLILYYIEQLAIDALNAL